MSHPDEAIFHHHKFLKKINLAQQNHSPILKIPPKGESSPNLTKSLIAVRINGNIIRAAAAINNHITFNAIAFAAAG